MNQRTSPAPEMGQEPILKLGSLQKNHTSNTENFKHPLSGKNRFLILEQLAEKWSNRGYYQSPARAMAALLGLTE